MDRAAVGIKAHNGWAAIVTVAGPRAGPRIVARERLVTASPDDPAARFPYHAAEQSSGDAASLVARYAEGARVHAAAALGTVLVRLGARFDVVGGALLSNAAANAKPRALPDLAGILASHALIHTAEGVLFRGVIESAAREHGLALHRVAERDVPVTAAEAFGLAPAALEAWAASGRALGAPWTKEHRVAAIAARLVLAGALA
jgi:hypothetical protein